MRATPRPILFILEVAPRSRLALVSHHKEIITSCILHGLHCRHQSSECGALQQLIAASHPTVGSAAAPDLVPVNPLDSFPAHTSVPGPEPTSVSITPAEPAPPKGMTQQMQNKLVSAYDSRPELRAMETPRHTHTGAWEHKTTFCTIRGHELPSGAMDRDTLPVVTILSHVRGQAYTQ